MEDNKAPRPQFINELPSIKQDEAEQDDKYKLEEQALAQVSLTGGWRLLDEYLKELEDELDNAVTNAIGNGATFSEIGQTAVVKEVAKSYIERIRAKVLDAQEAVENDG